MSDAKTDRTNPLKPQQRRALIHLAFLGGKIAKAGDLKPALDPKLRTDLVTHGMLQVGRRTAAGTPITLQDGGWRWVMENLASELPPKEQVAGMLMTILARVADFLKVNGLDVQDLILAKRMNSGVEKTAAPAPSTKQELLRIALELGGGHITEQIRLRDLRPRMEELGYTRAAVDDAIKALQIDGTLSVIPIDLPTDLNALDHAATINIAGEPRHAVIVRRRPSSDPSSR